MKAGFFIPRFLSHEAGRLISYSIFYKFIALITYYSKNVRISTGNHRGEKNSTNRG